MRGALGAGACMGTAKEQSYGGRVRPSPLLFLSHFLRKCSRSTRSPWEPSSLQGGQRGDGGQVRAGPSLTSSPHILTLYHRIDWVGGDPRDIDSNL